MNWQDLENELALWRSAGRSADFWWRDDDAGPSTPALERLLALARSSGVPLALAVVPVNLVETALLALEEGVAVIPHGADHINRASVREKKTEFPIHEEADHALERIAAAAAHLQGQTRARYVPALAPPWNRFREDLIPRLRASGIKGLTQYGPRRNPLPAPGVKQVNTHVDIIGWRTGRGFVGEPAALQATVRHLAARRAGEADAGEPTGLLTHHACHDDAAWRFLERLFAFTRERGARWHAAGELFG